MTKKPVNVRFADSYVGCSTLANIMGLHEETIRKRAKRGQIPGTLVNGKWTFHHAALAAAGIQPFASNPLTPATSTPIPPIARVNKTDVVFVLDRSSSMNSLMSQARRNLDDQFGTLRAAAGPNDLYNVTVITFANDVSVNLSRLPIVSVPGANIAYPSSGGMTALNDAVRRALDFTRLIDEGQAFLISIVTDGQENCSNRVIPNQEVADAIKTGRYTLAYAGPYGSQVYAQSLGVPNGNITTWEQTFEGTQALGRTSRSSLKGFTLDRSRGVLSSTSYYAQPVVSNPQDFAGRLGNRLAKLNPSDFRVERVMDGDPLVIKRFAERKLGGFQKGKVYYQLTESEKVQDYKEIVIQDTATGAFYSGRDAAAKLLGIPNFSGTVRIRPGELGEFKVFVQSTSVNRKLKPGTAVVCLP